jgi:hypothetical protein
MIERGLGLAAVSLRSAMETYFQAVADQRIKGHFLDRNLVTWMRSHGAGALPAELYHVLNELDATRNVIVHHGGIVTTRYVEQVANCTLVPGERRSITLPRVLVYASAVRRVAKSLYSLDAKG